MVGDNLIKRDFFLEMNLACWETGSWPYSTVHSLLTYSNVLYFGSFQKCHNEYYPLNEGNFYVNKKEGSAIETIPAFICTFTYSSIQEILLNMYYVPVIPVMCYPLGMLQ